MRQLGIVALAGLVVLASASNAFAGGYEYGTDNGAEAVARAGASTAYSNPMSQYTNIAGIADTPRYMIYISNNMIFRQVAFSRLQEPAVESIFGDIPAHSYDTVEDSTGSFPLGLSVAANIRLNNYLVLNIGLNGPASVGWGNFAGPNYARSDFEEGGDLDDTVRDDDGNWARNLSGGGRFDVTKMDVLFVWPTIGLGLTVPGFENLRIGASFSPQFAYLQFTNYAEASTGTEAEAELSLWDPFVPAGQVGFMLRLWRFDIGAQIRISADIEAEASASDSESGDANLTGYDPVTGEELDATVQRATFDSPWPRAVFRFGLRYAHPRADADENARMPWQRDHFDIEFDVVYENTSQVDGFDVTLYDVNITGIQMDQVDLFVRHNWEDTVSLRLGGSAHFWRGMLTVSAGVSYETAAVPNQFTRIDYTSWDRVGVAVGATFRMWLFELSVAYQHIWMPDRSVPMPETPLDSDGNVDNDQLCRLGACWLSANPIPPEDEATPIINAGDYSASYDIVSISLAIRWGEGSGIHDFRGGDVADEEDEDLTADPEPEPEEAGEGDATSEEAPEGDLALDAEEPMAEAAAMDEPMDSAVGGQNAPPSNPEQEEAAAE